MLDVIAEPHHNRGPEMQRILLPVAALLFPLSAIVLGQQASLNPKLPGFLRRIFPSAVEFSPRAGEPPHFTAYIKDPRSGGQTAAGLAFFTTELAPLERGYDGPIKILVGMDLKGILTGIVVVEHHEPYGNFSIDTPEFAAQFVGKNIHDPFTVGGDIDAVSGASLSISSASRAVKLSARKIARELLTPQASK
jgi:transcriptional regulator of nitric oxide reductase